VLVGVVFRIIEPRRRKRRSEGKSAGGRVRLVSSLATSRVDLRCGKGGFPARTNSSHPPPLLPQGLLEYVRGEKELARADLREACFSLAKPQCRQVPILPFALSLHRVSGGLVRK